MQQNDHLPNHMARNEELLAEIALQENDLADFRKNDPDNLLDLGFRLEMLARVYSEYGDTEKARDYSLQFLQAREQEFGAQSREMIVSISLVSWHLIPKRIQLQSCYWAEFYNQEFGQDEESVRIDYLSVHKAIKLLHQGVSIVDKYIEDGAATKDDVGMKCAFLRSLASAYIWVNQFEDAEVAARQCLEQVENFYGINTFNSEYALSILIIVLELCDQNGEASVFQKMLDLLPGPTDDEIAEAQKEREAFWKKLMPICDDAPASKLETAEHELEELRAKNDAHASSIISALFNLTYQHSRDGDKSKAREYCEQYTTALENSANPRELARALEMMHYVFYPMQAQLLSDYYPDIFQGEDNKFEVDAKTISRAIEMLERAVMIVEHMIDIRTATVQDLKLESDCLLHLASAYSSMGRLEEAQRAARRSLDYSALVNGFADIRNELPMRTVIMVLELSGNVDEALHMQKHLDALFDTDPPQMVLDFSPDANCVAIQQETNALSQ